jgi:hypothetical protein
MIRVGEIGDLAQEWVELHGRHLAGFQGAYLFGGIAGLGPDEPFATYRDVDLIVVLDSGTRGTDENLEVAYRGLMLEVGFIGLDEHRAEAVLARPDRAGTLARTRILADPSGVLTALQQEVARAYAERRWVVARCDVERQAVEEGLGALLDAPGPLPRLYGLIGAIFGLAGLLAVARLEVPTNRRALVGLKQMLEAEGRGGLHGEVLEVCGVASLSRAEVEAHHRAALRAFDLAVAVKRTFVPYSFKVQAHVRPYVDEAIAELIDEGHHREATLYLALPFSTTNAVVRNDASDADKLTTQTEFDRLLDDLDLLVPRDWAGRVERIRGLAAELEQIADRRVAAGT